MKSCLIVTGGNLETEFLKSYIKEKNFQYIAAVDGALAHMTELGLMPTHAVGDFDTINPEILALYEKEPSVLVSRHNPEKDESDTELALSLVLEAGAEDITIVGALGSRMDHTLANLGLLYKAHEKKIPCRILDSRNRITLIERAAVFRKSSLYGKYISFYPFWGKVKGLTLQGFVYPLSDYDMDGKKDASLCISNELSEEEAHLFIRSGILLCLETKD